MNAISGDVWTETADGWALRPCNAGDYQRREVMRSWLRGDRVTDQYTHELRPMRYADVMEEVRKHSVTERECAAREGAA